MNPEPTCNLSVNTACIRDSVSFFGAAPAGQQTVSGTLESVVAALVNLGLVSLETPVPTPEPVPCADPAINPSLCAGPLASGLDNTEVRDVSVCGDTIAVGTKNAGEGMGSVQVYFRSNGVWAQQGASLIGSDSVGASLQGTGVCVHGDTLVIGGPGDNYAQGAVWVFTRTESVWTQQGPKISVAGSNQFGTSVHLRGDTLVVGSLGDNDLQGSFSVFKRFEGSWIPEQTCIVPSDTVGAAHVGAIVKINDQENTIAVAGNWDNGSVGAVWVYRLVDDVWVQDGPKITGSDADNVPPNYQGYNVAISGDGNYLVFSGAYDAVQDGAVWAFNYVDGAWVQESAKIKWPGSLFGRSMDMTSCGNVMVVGTNVNVYVFKKIDGVWNYVCERTMDGLSDFASYISLDPAGGDLAVVSLDTSVSGLNVYFYRM